MAVEAQPAAPAYGLVESSLPVCRFEGARPFALVLQQELAVEVLIAVECSVHHLVFIERAVRLIGPYIRYAHRVGEPSSPAVVPERAEQHAVVHLVVAFGQITAVGLRDKAVVEGVLQVVVERFVIDFRQGEHDGFHVLGCVVERTHGGNLHGFVGNGIHSVLLVNGAVLIDVAELVHELPHVPAKRIQPVGAGDGQVEVERVVADGHLCEQLVHGEMYVVAQRRGHVVRRFGKALQQVSELGAALHDIGGRNDIVAQVLQAELVLQAVHQAAVNIDGAEPYTGVAYALAERDEREMPFVIPHVVDECRRNRISSP